MGSTSVSDEMKKSFEYHLKKVRALEEENKNLKLKVIELTQELEKRDRSESSARVCVERQDERLSAKRKCTVENKEEANPAGRSKKQRKGESENNVCNNEERSGVGEAIESTCVHETNALKEKQILESILSNLGKDDLLNVRMVNHAWNDESLKVLRKKKFSRILCIWSMEQCLRFAANLAEPLPLIIPFDLIFDISPSEPLDHSKPILASHVDTLCKVLDPHCVLNLTLFSDLYPEADLILMKLLAAISPGLETLNLRCFNVKIDSLRNQIITFPNLKRLTCNTSLCESGGREASHAYISIIENSPILEDLTLTHPCDLEDWPLNFNTLKSLSLDKLIKPQNILDKILACSGPPVLRELSFEYQELVSAEDMTVVYTILNSVSSTLKSLRLRGDLFELKKAGELRFPNLPHLEHLGMKWDVGSGCWLSAKNMNFTQESFPSLKSIDLPTGLIFLHSQYSRSAVQSEEDEDVEIQFPNLNKLTLTTRATSTTGLEDLNMTLEYLPKIFPTPSELCLRNGSGENCGKNLLYRVMKSNWSKNIQHIRMYGFRELYFGRISEKLEFLPRVDLEKCYGMSEELFKIEYQDIMNKIRMEFVEGEVFGGSIILTRRNQSNCQNDK